VKEVYLISRTKDDPFAIRKIVTFGKADKSIPPYFTAQPILVSTSSLPSSSGFKVHIGGILDNTSKKELEELFTQHSKKFVVRSIKMFNDKGFAFVELDSEEERQRAIKEINGKSLGSGKKVRVSPAKN